jgi:2-polyprenyl-3-methyl-5-hydroxy-6-metoxy-1,4-benzoquinol methylase
MTVNKVCAVEDLLRDGSFQKAVKEQYEEYPYPIRDPEFEKENLIAIIPEAFDLLSHRYYEGKLDINNLKILVAGGGTGDSAIYFAEQLRETNSEVIYIDLSQASMNIAKKRADIRKLKNIRWISGSLLDLPDMGLGKFDIINCSGVLHHLKEPELGFFALKEVLKEDGVMNIMLYATYGREVIYKFKKLFFAMHGDKDLSSKQQVFHCKNLLHEIRNTNLGKSLLSLGIEDIKYDAGVYDLFLHSCDQPYTVDKIYEVADKIGMRVQKLNGTATPEEYNPEHYVDNLKQELSGISLRKKQEIAEVLHGNMSKHSFVLAHKDHKKANINLINDYIPKILAWRAEDVRNTAEGLQITFKGGVHRTTITLAHSQNLRALIEGTDGKTITKQILKKVQKTYKKADKPSFNSLLEEFHSIYNNLEKHGLVVLRHKSIPHYLIPAELQDRAKTHIKSSRDREALTGFPPHTTCHTGP